MSTDRSAEEVFRDHLTLRSRGEVEQDIERNYDPDVTLIRSGAVYQGQDGVRYRPWICVRCTIGACACICAPFPASMT